MLIFYMTCVMFVKCIDKTILKNLGYDSIYILVVFKN